jgi:hypothetical protein
VKTFYSAADIEALASQGVRELVVDDDTVLTSVAREAAAQYGLKLITPGQRSGAGAASPAPVQAPKAAAANANPAKPRGCQHGPAAAGGSSQASTPNRTSSPVRGPGVVDDLIGAVKQLAKRS